MNPPYCRNLHLKILSEAINHSDDIVNLSPIRWLQDPLVDYKDRCAFQKFENIRKCIESVDIIAAATSQQLFNAPIWTDLGIYHLTSDGGFDHTSLWDHKWFIDKVILKVKDNIEDHCTRIGTCDFSYPYIKLSGLHGHHGSYDFYDFISPRLDIAKSNKTSSGHCTVNFETEEESINFFKSLQTKFYRFINICIKRDMHVPWRYAPWLGDYTHSWSDSDLYAHFELTEDEIKTIEEIVV